MPNQYDNPLTKKDKEFILDSYTIITIEQIAKELNRKINTINSFIYKKRIELSKKGLIMKRSKLSHSEQQKRKHNDGLTKKLKLGYDEITTDLAYIIGVLNGDGSLSVRTFCVTTIDYDFAIKIIEFIERWSGLKAKLYKYENGKTWNYLQGFHYEVRLYSKMVFNFLYQFYVSKNKDFAINNINKILDSNETKKAFVEGFFDSEGDITKEFRVRISNNNINLLNYLTTILKSFSISSVIYMESKGRNPNYRINIQNIKDISKFCKLFNSSIKRKQDRIIESRVRYAK